MGAGMLGSAGALHGLVSPQHQASSGWPAQRGCLARWELRAGPSLDWLRWALPQGGRDLRACSAQLLSPYAGIHLSVLLFMGEHLRASCVPGPCWALEATENKPSVDSVFLGVHHGPPAWEMQNQGTDWVRAESTVPWEAGPEANEPLAGPRGAFSTRRTAPRQRPEARLPHEPHPATPLRCADSGVWAPGAEAPGSGHGFTGILPCPQVLIRRGRVPIVSLECVSCKAQAVYAVSRSSYVYLEGHCVNCSGGSKRGVSGRGRGRGRAGPREGGVAPPLSARSVCRPAALGGPHLQQPDAGAGRDDHLDRQLGHAAGGAARRAAGWRGLHVHPHGAGPLR